MNVLLDVGFDLSLGRNDFRVTLDNVLYDFGLFDDHVINFDLILALMTIMLTVV